MRNRKLAAAALIGAAVALSGCATGLPTKVTRYSAMPIPQGQSFYVVPGEGIQPGLEFGRYASLVARQMEAKGYRWAGAPQNADMLVELTYDVDDGTREYSVDPLYRARARNAYFRGYYDPFYDRYFGRPYWSRFGYYGARSPFYWGWDDPFWYASPYSGFGFDDPIREYTVYHSALDVDIMRRADQAPLFEGKAQARSQTDELGVLVPNLIEAMFTNFPGRNGETVKITVPARKRG